MYILLSLTSKQAMTRHGLWMEHTMAALVASWIWISLRRQGMHDGSDREQHHMPLCFLDKYTACTVVHTVLLEKNKSKTSEKEKHETSPA